MCKHVVLTSNLQIGPTRPIVDHGDDGDCRQKGIESGTSSPPILIEGSHDCSLHGSTWFNYFSVLPRVR